MKKNKNIKKIKKDLLILNGNKKKVKNRNFFKIVSSINELGISVSFVCKRCWFFTIQKKRDFWNKVEKLICKKCKLKWKIKIADYLKKNIL